MKEIEIQESQIRQIFASVVWTHKIQEKQADLYKKRYKLMETIKIILATLTSSGIFAILFVDKYWLKLASAIVSGISLFISIYCETNDLKLEADAHKRTAHSLLILREKLISILSNIKCNKLSYEEIIIQKEELYNEYFEICRESKDTGNKAVKQASDNLKIRQDNTYSEEEIDSFLPIALKRNSKKD